MKRFGISASWLSSAGRTAFLIFFVLVMLSYAQSWDHGPFTWAGRPVSLPPVGATWRIGPLSLLPGIVSLVIIVHQFIMQPRPEWSWGDGRVFWPLLAISILTLIHLWRWRHASIAASMALFWLTYLFVVNDIAGRQSGRVLTSTYLWVFVLIVIIQATVGVAQFILQRDLGLLWLGEPALDPQVPGISIVVKDGLRWLRAYGLNSHPNRLGLKMTTFFLLLWPFAVTGPRYQRGVIWLALVTGFVGLLVSLSRSAWLGLAAGLSVYGLSWLKTNWKRDRFLPPSRMRLSLLATLIMITLLFVAVYGDALVGRVTPSSNDVEQRSFSDRSRDMQVAWELLRTAPWQGVGLGNSPAAGRAVHPFAGMVHLVPLLIGAEMGIPGVLLWLLLLLAPLARRDLLSRYTLQAAVWVALLVFSLFQPEPTMFKMNTAVLLGLIAALWTRPERFFGMPSS